MSDLCEVVITAPDPDWLLDLTRQLVAEGLCASVHHFSPVRSIYRWHGEIIEGTEGRASLHTRTALVEQIVERVKAQHPYEVPGISARPIIAGTRNTSAGYATKPTAPTASANRSRTAGRCLVAVIRRQAP
jgi:periplasmic divalent cation tolerance protein